MPLSDLDEQDHDVIRKAIAFQIRQWDWESPIVLGFDRDELVTLIAAWPPLDDGEEASTARIAIHACVGDLVGLRGIKDADCLEHLGVDATTLAHIFARWHGDFQYESPLDFMPSQDIDRDS